MQALCACVRACAPFLITFPPVQLNNNPGSAARAEVDTRVPRSTARAEVDTRVPGFAARAEVDTRVPRFAARAEVDTRVPRSAARAEVDTRVPRLFLTSAACDPPQPVPNFGGISWKGWIPQPVGG